MNNDLTDITIILDRSGSMLSVREATIAGYNTFLQAQAKLPGSAVVSLVQFDDRYEVVYEGVPCGDTKPLTEARFVPRGNTALLDAIGRTINEIGARLSARAERDRPGKVIVVILTDGMENASHEFTREQVHALIDHQREHYSWDFVFLGANQDAIATGASIGVPSKSSLSYAADKQGTSEVMASASAYVGTMRSGGQASFTAADRAKQARS